MFCTLFFPYRQHNFFLKSCDIIHVHVAAKILMYIVICEEVQSLYLCTVRTAV